MKHYTAITIGPIVRTLLQARKTRELWASSYVFSWLMKQVCAELRKDSTRKFIMPFADQKDTLEVFLSAMERGQDFYGAGIFPDRIIYATPKKEDLSEVQAIFTSKIKLLAEDIFNILQTQFTTQEVSNWRETIFSYLLDYFNVHFLTQSLPEKENPIFFLSPILDSLEQRQSFPSEYRSLFYQYLSKASLSTIPLSKLSEDAFGARRPLDLHTMEHIAVREFLGQSKEVEFYDEDNPGNLIEAYKKHPHFQPAHKYVAIVQADGDNVGKIIKGLSNESEFQAFSQKLTEYSIEAVKLIHRFGGLPVYAGGDDLLFFAPVLNKASKIEEKNIFSLLQRLDNLFQGHMATLISPEKSSQVMPSQSFGLSIAYFKYPLYESLQSAQRLLFEVAKDTDIHPKKNVIAFELRRHSGSTAAGRLELSGDEAVASTYATLLDELFNQENRQVLGSVVHKFRREDDLVSLFGQNKARISAFVDNSFNESIHQRDSQRIFLSHMKSLIPAIYLQASAKNPDLSDPDDPLHPHVHLYGLLKCLQFLTDDQSS